MNSRGIILTSEFGSHLDGNSMWIKGGIDPLHLRKYLLYFDKVDWPTNNIIGFKEESKDIEILKEENILKRTKISLSYFTTENYGADQLKEMMQLGAFFINNKHEYEEWAIAQPTQKLILPNDQTLEKKSVEVSLYKCLPTPRKDVSIESILEFKEKRHDELISLRGALDDLYLDIILSQDIPRSKNRAIQRIENNISELEKLMTEKGLKHFLSTFNISINIKHLGIGALAGYGTGTSFGLPLIGSSFGALFSAINFDIDLLKKPKEIPSKLKAYAYLSGIKKRF